MLLHNLSGICHKSVYLLPENHDAINLWHHECYLLYLASLRGTLTTDISILLTSTTQKMSLLSQVVTSSKSNHQLHIVGAGYRCTQAQAVQE